MKQDKPAKLCIIPCGKKKIWDTLPGAAGAYAACETYTGTLHRKCQAYARRHFSDWVILSAKHGFLLPEDRVDSNYDIAFGSGHREIISSEQLMEQVAAKGLADRFDEIVVLGGVKFTHIVPPLFPHIPIVYPLLGSKGIGHMLQRLEQALRADTEIAGDLREVELH